MNGTCKTAILQAIALAALGADRANQVDPPGIAELRNSRAPNGKELKIVADFSFGGIGHDYERVYPGYAKDARPPTAPDVTSTLTLGAKQDLFDGRSAYSGDGMPDSDPLKEIRTRAKTQPHWMVLGYGVHRNLRTGADLNPDVLSRVASLFKPSPLAGPRFYTQLPEELRQTYADTVNSALTHAEGTTPELLGLEFIESKKRVLDDSERYRARMRMGRDEVSLPLTALSQGYQSAIAWIADVVGQVFWEAQQVEDRPKIPLAEMEGLVLIDELDLHLHPRWQVGLIRALGQTFENLQFIVTTHSPMLLTGLDADEIVRLDVDDDGRVVRLPPTQTPKLMTGSELYDVYFGLDELYPNDLARTARLHSMLAANRRRTLEQQTELVRLGRALRAAGIEPGPVVPHRSADA